MACSVIVGSAVGDPVSSKKNPRNSGLLKKNVSAQMPRNWGIMNRMRKPMEDHRYSLRTTSTLSAAQARMTEVCHTAQDTRPA